MDAVSGSRHIVYVHSIDPSVQTGTAGASALAKPPSDERQDGVKYGQEDLRNLYFQIDNLFHTRVNIFFVAETLFFVAAMTAWSQSKLVLMFSGIGLITTCFFTITNTILHCRLRWLTIQYGK